MIARELEYTNSARLSQLSLLVGGDVGWGKVLSQSACAQGNVVIAARISNAASSSIRLSMSSSLVESSIMAK